MTFIEKVTHLGAVGLRWNNNEQDIMPGLLSLMS